MTPIDRALPVAGTYEPGPKRPPQRTIALAISIVSSKPDGVSVREYIRLLRQHVAKGRRENAISSVYRHLDRSSYWRAECERVKAALDASGNEVTSLRKEVEALKARLEAEKPVTGGAKKRKKGNEALSAADREPKKAKGDASHDGRPSETENEMSFNLADLGEDGNTILYSLFQVQNELKSQSQADQSVLAHHLVRTASALPQVVRQTIQQCTKRFLTGPELLKTNLTAAARAIGSLIVGFKCIIRAPDAAEIQGQIIYAYVQMFQGLLKVLELASDIEAKRIARSNNLGTSGNRPTTSSGKAKTQQHQQRPAGNLKSIATLNSITILLCSILDQLDPKTEAHKALFEGFAYTAIDYVGSRLYLSIFGRRRAGTLSEEIAASNEAGPGLDDQDPKRSMNVEDFEVKKASLEAPYLAHLLARLIAAAPAHMGAVNVTRAGKAKVVSAKNASKNALVVHAKDRLQRTLVNCMFGTEGQAENDELQDCLKKPTLLQKGEKTVMPKIKDTEVQDWFKEEVWKLIGWEILGKEGADL